MTKRVAVLMGGFSAEREVSLSSGRGIVKALESLGYDVLPIDVTRDIAKLVADLTPKPDVVVNILHGRWGEDGCVQGLLELMDIPYTNSGVLGSAMSMNKDIARRICQDAGIPCAEGLVVELKDFAKGHPMAPPYVVKPITEGSSIGVYIIEREDSPKPDFKDWEFGEHALVERYIPGREINVAVVNGKAIGSVEIRAKTDFYDYKAKYTEGFADHLIPAPVPAEVHQKLMDYAERAHAVLMCRGVSRSDFRYDDTKGEPGEIIYLETNPQPGMTPLSLVPEIAAHEGLSYADVVQIMVEDASCSR